MVKRKIILAGHQETIPNNSFLADYPDVVLKVLKPKE